MVQRLYDFGAFLRDLARIRAEEMTTYIRSEIASVNDVRTRVIGTEFDRARYLSKLRAVLQFLENGEQAAGLANDEREACLNLAGRLIRPRIARLSRGAGR